MSIRRDPRKHVHPVYAYGDVLPQYIGRYDSIQFDFRKGCSILLIFLPDPTQEELREIKYQPFEARMTCLPDVLWLTFRFGNLGFMDAPFSPHLTNGIQYPTDLDGACDILQIFVIDSATGTVKAIRAISYSEGFSAALRVGCMCLLPQDFNATAYDYLLCSTQQRYSAEEIAKAATVVFSANADNDCPLC